MSNGLKQYFPMIQTREELCKKIQTTPELKFLFDSWDESQQEEFLQFCTGMQGVKILYDSFFKEILNPDTAPSRLEELLSLILQRHIRILHVLPNDSSRIAEENALLIMDIVVQLEDGSIANIEVQKIGYSFPGQRSACYSADLLLRQYKRAKNERKKKFSYRDIKSVYTIVFIEKSSGEMKRHKQDYVHHFCQKSDTGLHMELLQEFVFIPLDIYRETRHNKGIKNDLDAWLTFLSEDNPEIIVQLIKQYPKFISMYREIYELCRNVEKVMGLFSKELQILDKNTVQYMIDQMQDTIDEQQSTIQEQQNTIKQKSELLASQEVLLQQKESELEQLKKQLEEQCK